MSKHTFVTSETKRNSHGHQVLTVHITVVDAPGLDKPEAVCYHIQTRTREALDKWFQLLASKQSL